MAEGDARVPAGWYPDPLGLPQLRWWDNHAWTEYTSDARQPMVVQETSTQQTRLAFADDVRHSADVASAETVAAGSAATSDTVATDGDGAGIAIATPTAEALLSLEAPVREELVEEELSPAAKFAEFMPDNAPTTAAFDLDTRFDDLLGEPTDDTVQVETQPFAARSFVTEPFVAQPFTAESSTAEPFTAAPFTAQPVAAEPVAAQPVATQPVAAAAAPVASQSGRAVLADIPVGTGAAWAVAMTPVYTTLVSAFLVASLITESQPVLTRVLGVVLPYLAGVILALVDARILRSRGLRPPFWLLAFVPGPVYLIVRFVKMLRQTGRGFAPFVGYVVATIFAFTAIIAVPGLVIAQQPEMYSQQAAAAAVTDAHALGADIAVSCPSFPPVIVGETFVCRAHEIGSTKNINVTVSLQHENGFISWRVDDWGSLAVQGAKS